MGFKRVELILRTDRSPPPPQIAKLDDNHRFTQAQNFPKYTRRKSYRRNRITAKLRGRPIDSTGQGGG